MPPKDSNREGREAPRKVRKEEFGTYAFLCALGVFFASFAVKSF
jgi:hypothetical protein